MKKKIFATIAVAITAFTLNFSVNGQGLEKEFTLDDGSEAGGERTCVCHTDLGLCKGQKTIISFRTHCNCFITRC